jgi:hypothetical protein
MSIVSSILIVAVCCLILFHHAQQNFWTGNLTYRKLLELQSNNDKTTHITELGGVTAKVSF